ncbi:ScpA family protein [Geitlerinema sp. PCC 9228]|jgi:segregation and condensation protein A|uniref:segregation/condensation protein A n=1 Tax=Geitlerinema sp. PCC 9228 TaxID=111611 RepID=UPI0008F9D913|nr:ScpA family protein [Geitlerinema sp. PCC 9228]
MSKALGILTQLSQSISQIIERAQRGEIDPWDVRVIEAIDRYLSQLDFATQSDLRVQEQELSLSGQAFLQASMLVLLKADRLDLLASLEAEETEATADGEAELDATANGSEPSLPPRLEKYLRRRGVAPKPQKRQASLEELLAQLQKVAQVMQEKPQKPRQKRRSHRQNRLRTVQSITRLTQEENVTETAAALEKFLQENWPSLAAETSWLSLEHLLLAWSRGNEMQEEKVRVFWALLVLSAQSKVELWQERFYGDIRMRWLEAPVSQNQRSLSAPPSASK